MRDPKRIDKIIDSLEELWLKNPDLRFGQLIYNLSKQGNIDDIFNPEDDVWLYAINKELNGNSVANHEKCVLAKGIRTFVCIECGEPGSNYANGVAVCDDCCTKKNICKICGLPKIKKPTHHAHCSLVRGIKSFKCIVCGKDSTNYSNGVEVCKECCEKQNVCCICGCRIFEP
jgi:uncharacterized protein YihD (DUF1040 family)